MNSTFFIRQTESEIRFDIVIKNCLGNDNIKK